MSKSGNKDIKKQIPNTTKGSDTSIALVEAIRLKEDTTAEVITPPTACALKFTIKTKLCEQQRFQSH